MNISRQSPKRGRWYRLLIGLMAAVVAVAACGGDGTSTTSSGNATSIPDDATSTTGAVRSSTTEGGSGFQPPTDVDTEFGTFTLAESIRERVLNGDPLRVVLSMEGPAIPVFGPQYKFGFEQTVVDLNNEPGLEVAGNFLGPVPPDINEQINQVTSAVAAGQVDCLSVEGGGASTWISVIDDLIDQGIPVFTVGEDIVGSRRLGTFHTDWDAEGRMAAQSVVDYFESNGLTLEEVAMVSSVPDQPFAQTRMNAFAEEIQALNPSVVLANTPENAVNGTFDPATTYSALRAFVTGHPNVQVIYHTDVNAGVIDSLIADLQLEGEMFAVGHNVSEETLAAIQDGRQISTIDQDFPAQSRWAAEACVTFLTTGEILPNSATSVLVTAENVDEAIARLRETTG